MEDLQFNKFEYISPDGLRLDGRRAKEIRSIKCKQNVFKKSDGSCFYQQGNSKVIAIVHGPSDVKIRSQILQDRARLKCEYTISKFATGSRISRSTKIEKECALVIRQTFEKIIFTDLFPRSEINIFVRIIEDDGGILSCAINAVSVALIDAGIPTKDFIVSCSSAILEGTPICDSNNVEQMAGGAQLSLAILPNLDQKVAQIKSRELNKKSISLKNFEEMMKIAMNGCMVIHKFLTSKLKEDAKKKFEKRIL